MLIIYFLLFLFLAIKNLKLGIFWIIFTLPAYLIRFSVFGFPTTLLEISILLLFVVWLVKQIKQVKFYKFSITNYQLLITIALFLIAATISIFVSPSIQSAAGIWKAYFIEPILFLIVFVSTIKREDLKRVFMFSCFNVFLLSIFALYQKFTGAFIFNEFWAAEATRRVTSVFPYPNALALFLAPVVIILLGYFVYQIKNSSGNWKLVIGNYLYLVSCILGVLAIYFTKSKGALLAVLAGIIFYAIFYKGYRKIFITILIITIIAFITIIASNPDLLKGSATIEGGDSISTRVDMWKEAWQMLKTKPLLGAGLAGYQTAVAQFHEKDYIEIFLYPHNIFLNFWTEIGLLGLLAFVGIVIWFYKSGFKLMRDKLLNCYIVILLAGMTALLVHGLVDVPYFKNDLSILFWIIIGIMIVIKSQTAKGKKPLLSFRPKSR